MAGILPETVGSVAGAIIGAPGIVTGAAGAGAGAAAGQALEEGIESLLGVQKQTLPEVGKDIALEAALAGTVDLVGMGVFRAGKSIVGGAANRMAGAEALDAARGVRLTEAGYAPSLERLGAPQMLAYSQKFGEGATRDTGRIVNNTALALEQKAAMLDNLATIEQAGDAFSDVASAQFKALDDSVKQAQESSLQAVKDSVNILERSLDEGIDINDETLGAITSAFTNFQDVATGQFRIMDDMLGRLEFTDAVEGVVKEGGKARIVPTNSILGAADDLIKSTGSERLLNDNVRKAINGIRDLGEYGSFENIANQRKIINDVIFSGTDLGDATTKQLFALRNAMDDALSSVNLNQIKGLARGQNSQLQVP